MKIDTLRIDEYENDLRKIQEIRDDIRMLDQHYSVVQSLLNEEIVKKKEYDTHIEHIHELLEFVEKKNIETIKTAVDNNETETETAVDIDVIEDQIQRSSLETVGSEEGMDVTSSKKGKAKSATKKKSNAPRRKKTNRKVKAKRKHG
ncbi:hypothetical protein RB195_020424 [Necator americanus]